MYPSAHTFNPSLPGARGRQISVDFKANLDYEVNSRTASATPWVKKRKNKHIFVVSLPLTNQHFFSQHVILFYYYFLVVL